MHDPKLENWMKSAHEIGLVQFGEARWVLTRFTQDISQACTPVGLFEADAICIDNLSDEIVVLDHDVIDRRRCVAANDQRSLISALELAKRYFSECTTAIEFGESRAETMAAQ
jgi:hypothetical protein